MPERRFKASYAPPELAAQRLERGEVDAIFFVGGAPVGLVHSLLGSGMAVLVPIDGAGRKQLTKEDTGLTPEAIPAGDYGRKSIETVGVHAVLIVNDSQPADIVYGMTKALFNPANRTALDDAHPSARFIRLDDAAKDPPAPLHPGAARFYREAGVMPRTGG